MKILIKELKKTKAHLAAEQKRLLKKTKKLQELMNKLEKCWKAPVDYQELLALSKKPLHR